MIAPTGQIHKTPAEPPGFWFVLAALAVVFYGSYLAGDIPVGADNSLFYAPFYSLRWDGGPPLWNRFSMSGSPLADNLQAAMLYPPRWPFFFTDWRNYFGPFNFIHYLVALIGMGVFLRILKLSPTAALVGAIVFAGSGHMAGRVINPTIFYACCWLPLLLAGAAGGERRHGWLTTLAMAMIATIGSPHLLFYGTLAYGVTLLVLARGSLRDIARLCVARGFYLGLGFLMAAPTALPGVLRAGRSVRTLTTVEANLRDSVGWGEIFPVLLGGTGTQVYPEYIDKSGYVGPLLLVAILFLFLSRGVWRDRRLWAGLALVGLGFYFALGRNIGLQFIVPYVPGLKLLAGPARALVLAAAGLAVLAALAADRLAACDKTRALRWAGAALIGLGILAALRFHFAIAGASRQYGPIPALEWARAWLYGPGSVPPPLFRALDAATVFVAGGVATAVLAKRTNVLACVLAAILFAELLHFSPRVWPPIGKGTDFNPSPQVQFLATMRDADPAQPFRFAAFDAIQTFNSDYNDQHKFNFLLPNLSTLYGLEDIRGFDPLILKDYEALFARTGGRSAIDDPIRTLNFARPDDELFDWLNVRYLIGGPWDRTLSLSVQTLTTDNPLQAPLGWTDFGTTAPITAWSFVSQVNAGVPLEIGHEMATLIVEADEGTFRFPVRYGIETGYFGSLNKLRLKPDPDWRAITQVMSTAPFPRRGYDYKIRLATFRARIDFGRPLRARAVEWELAEPRASFFIESQAYRLARSAGDPWKLAFGSESDVAPVYEYTNATPRAMRVDDYAVNPAGAAIDPGLLRAAHRAPDSKFVSYRTNSLTVETEGRKGGLLVLREIWTPGWTARVNGKDETVLRVNDLLRGIPVPPGKSTVELAYRPRLNFALLAVALAALMVTISCQKFVIPSSGGANPRDRSA
ncbi:MAG: YfhO family protein [Candidatus Sumerlaeia bacterium]